MPHYDTTDVFTPAGVPTVTYVYRGEQDLETQLRRALKTPGLIISLSGPSKSGKTVLIKKVIPEENLIPISGGSIRSAEMLWDRVLNWMQAPSETTAKSPSGKGLSGRGGRDSEGLSKPSLEPRCGPRPLGGSIAAKGCVTKLI